MDFEKPDLQRFPCLRLAQEAISAGGIMPTILNAANEIAVDAFLKEKVKFTDIALIIEQTMAQFDAEQADSLEKVLAADKRARNTAEEIITTLGK